MRKLVTSTLGLVFLSGLAAPRVPERNGTHLVAVQPRPGLLSRARAGNIHGRLPMRFEPNRGQADKRVQFLSRGAGYTLSLTSHDAALEVSGRHRSPQIFRMALVGSNPQAEARGLDELPGKSNYFLGNDPTQWRTSIPNYAKVKYTGAYPGIDLIYYGKQRQLEYDFVVAPGADPARIRLAFDGRGGAREGGRYPIRVVDRGDLVLRAGAAEVRMHRPVAYQPVAGTSGTRRVDARFVLRGRSEVGIAVGAYDRTRPLVIDPVLSYSTYLGGSNADIGYAIAVDSTGNVYVTGGTASGDFPTASALQTTNLGSSNVFVSKLDPTATTLVYSTYLGGNGFDLGNGIAVDSSGNAYVAGFTSSANFPTKAAFQSAYGGNGDAFVAKLDAAGSSLVFSSYLGGTGADFGQGIALDSTGNAYVTGSTTSPDFPTAPSTGSLQLNCGGFIAASATSPASCPAPDAFVAEVKVDGSALTYSTYLGGSAADSGQAIAVDASGNAFVTGFTSSPDFPTLSPFQAACGGISAGTCPAPDAFVAKVNSTGTALLYSTYLGGSGLDRAFGVAVDGAGDAYVTGQTESTDFPSPGALQPQCGGFSAGPPPSCPASDAFVSKLDPAGSTLLYSTYLGGSDVDEGFGIAVDSSGEAFVTGLTQSNDFPSATPVKASFGGGTCGGAPCPDAFIAKLDANGASLSYSTYLGGNGADFGQAIALDSFGAAFVTGSTASTNFPTTVGVLQPVIGGSALFSDAFVVKIDPSSAPGVSLSPQKVTFAKQGTGSTSPAQSVGLINVGSAPLNITSITFSGTDATDFAETDNCTSPIAASGGTCSINITFKPATTGTKTAAMAIADDAAGSPQQVALSGEGVTPAPAVTLSPASLEFPDEPVGTASPAQTVTLTNSGSDTLNLTKVAITGDFAENDDCLPSGSTSNSLAVGASCTFTVTFTPTGSGTRSGNLTITDNATGSPQSVSLKGTGLAVFSLSSDIGSTTLNIGTASTTFKISASGPADFTNKITLACASGATCSFNPSSIALSDTSTMTVSGLSANTANPFKVSVNGTSGSQTASVSVTIVFSDYTLSASPPLQIIAAGKSTTYTVTVTSTNGFNQQVSFSCGPPNTLPKDLSCSFSPSSVTLDGTSASTTILTVNTVARTSAWPRGGWHDVPPPSGMIVFLVWLVALAGSGWIWTRQRGKTGGSRSPRALVRRACLALGASLVSLALSGACGRSYEPVPPNPGLAPGNYTLGIIGTYKVGTNSVTRATTVNLSVS